MKRLQVLLTDREMLDIRCLARRERITVGEWVRRVLREPREQKPLHALETNLKAIRWGAEFSFLTADIDETLGEIERGYQA